MPPPPPLSLEWSGVCDPDPFSLNPQTECGIHSSVMLAIYILAEEGRGGRLWSRERERAFPICNPPFPEKEERERKGVYFIFAASLGTTL